jgi:biotin carboxyl carrier protein
MYSDIQEVRALLLQFERAHLRDMYLRAGDWAVFMTKLDGASNPMLAVEPLAASEASVRLTGARAPHLGLFDPVCVVGDVLEKGAVIGAIDVLGRRTEVTSEAAGTIVSLSPAALVEFGESLVELGATA